jgi:hypothetical protein
MLGKLIWEKSGDEIKFTPTFPDLLTYYVETVNSDRVNSFSLNTTKFDSNIVNKLSDCIKNVSNISEKIPFEIDTWDGDVVDQAYLNSLHRQWVLTGLKYPKMPLLLRKVGNLDNNYRDINNLIHKVEASFDYTFVNYTQDPYQIDNIFGPKILGFDTANISIGFDNLGRSSWSKFSNFDENAADQDTNNFEKLSGLIHFNLNRPLSRTAPKEYVNWCNLHKIPVVGDKLSLGNIVNLESKLTDLRKIVIRNTNEQNDRFIFEIYTK